MFEIFPGVDTCAMSIIPDGLDGVVSNGEQFVDGVGTGGSEGENIIGGVFDAHELMSSATFDAGAGFS